MADPPIAYPPPPSPPPPSIMPMFYYSLIIIATVAGLLALYNLIIIKCGMYSADYRRNFPGPTRMLRRRSISTFKYKSAAAGSNECAVCLSAFEEGEELKCLPNCKHTFHAPCIDMWLYSHDDCPLCRTPVVPPVEQPERRREVLVGPVDLV